MKVSLRGEKPPEQCETPAAPPTPALWAAPWHSSSASSSRRTCVGLSGAHGVRPSRDARRGPTGKQHVTVGKCGLFLFYPVQS